METIKEFLRKIQVAIMDALPFDKVLHFSFGAILTAFIFCLMRATPANYPVSIAAATIFTLGCETIKELWIDTQADWVDYAFTALGAFLIVVTTIFTVI